MVIYCSNCGSENYINQQKLTTPYQLLCNNCIKELNKTGKRLEIKTYQLWCSYCGVDLILTQDTQPTPYQLVCKQCLSILDSYEVKETDKGIINECQEI